MLLLAATGGCTGPATRFLAAAQDAGLAQEALTGTPLPHTVFWLRRGTPDSPRVHLYLDGDGSPWLGTGRIATDPSARDPLILDLLRRDDETALLLGRPCYYQPTPVARCEPWLWTMGRYSEAVVASLEAAAKTLLARYPRAEVTLIGFSGGGTLAVLLAPRLPRVNAVVTLAANLDIDAWTAAHDYTPLAGSLNPATLPPLPASIRQRHLFGARDRDVPRALAARFLERQVAAEVVEVPGFDHRCCWVQAWPALRED